MRIALLSDPGLVNSNYRAYQPMQALARRGHELSLNRAGEAIDEAMALAADVVHIHRLAMPDLRQIVRHARRDGIGVVWDNDDDVAALPSENPNYARLGPRGRRELLAGVAEMLRLADVVTAPSAVLAERYRAQGAQDVRVLENYLPRELLDPPRPQHDGVVVACLAGLEHAADYRALGIDAALRALMEAHPQLRVLSIGVAHDLPPERCEHVPLAGFLDLGRILARADVGVAPLADTAWNRARSNVKLKEYAAAGLCWLASPTGPYLGMGEAQGGRLVADGDWHAALERLLVHGRERRKLAKRAVRWARGERIEDHAQRWEAVLAEAVERGRARGDGPAALSRARGAARR
jgi:glycosyltransferase involved in cell wall biosynthesis